MGCGTSANVACDDLEKALAAAGDGVQVRHVGMPKQPQQPFHQQYILNGKLGKGAFGQVHLATAVAHGSEVAVKITDLHVSQDGDECDAVDRSKKRAVVTEVAILRRVCGLPHCVAIHEDYLEGLLSYVVMERCDMTLLQALETTPDLTERALVRITREMLHAIDGIHGRSVVHRDIKPENFLFTGEELTVKLCDFGLAEVLPRHGQLEGLYGTPPFMSPEMLRGDRYGTKTDVWSLGVVVYALLCGQLPYGQREPTAGGVMRAIAEGAPAPAFVPAPGLDPQGAAPSPAALALVRLLLSRSPAGRPSAAGALQLEWLACPADPRRGDRSLRPALEAAKLAGAFAELWARKSLARNNSLDATLAAMQAKHHGRNPRDASSSEATARHSNSSKVTTLPGSSPNGSFDYTDPGSWASHQSGRAASADNRDASREERARGQGPA